MKRACVCEKCLLQRLPRWKKAEQSFDILSLRKSTYNLFTLNRFNSSSSPAFTIFKMDERVFFLSLKTIHTHTPILYAEISTECHFRAINFYNINRMHETSKSKIELLYSLWIGEAQRLGVFGQKSKSIVDEENERFFFFFQRNDRQTK